MTIHSTHITFTWLCASLCCVYASFIQAQDSVSGPLQITFIKVPAGEFMMGTPDLVEALFEMDDPQESSVQDEQPVHLVRITQPFYLSQTEITQGQWFQLMGTKPGPERLWQQDQWQQLPVVSVSWMAVQTFIQKLNQQDPGHAYQLPTEAQWEYAARAGDPNFRPFENDNLEEYAWLLSNSGDVPHPVAQKKPNAWGFYDTLGNAWEWVADWYAADYYAASTVINPTGPDQPSAAKNRARRGGSYHCKQQMVRPGYRAADTPDTAYTVLGFRLRMDQP